jgi:hypothetical protein
MSLFSKLQVSIDQIIADYRKANEDGKLSFSEIFTLVGNAVATFVHLMETFGEGTGAEKKAAVLLAVDKFFDEVITPIDIKGIPNFLEPVFDSSLKNLVMALADGWVDTLVNIFDRLGWGGDIENIGPQAMSAASLSQFDIY